MYFAECLQTFAGELPYRYGGGKIIAGELPIRLISGELYSFIILHAATNLYTYLKLGRAYGGRLKIGPKRIPLP
jgi:hypothetical protein